MFHRNNKSKVVYYHDVGTKYTEMGTDFAIMQKHFIITEQCGYKIVSQIDEAVGQVMICFDDGWAGIYDVKDFFLKMKIYPTIFIAVDLIGKEGYLTIDKIKELDSLGFHFMAHTWSHKDLTSFDDSLLEHELKDSKEWFEQVFAHPFDALCFPMGRFSKKVKEKSLEFGYTQLYTSIPGSYYDLIDDHLISRICVQNASLLEYKWLLNGASSLYRRKIVNQQVVADNS